MTTSSLRFAPLPSTRAPVRRRVAVSSPGLVFSTDAPSPRLLFSSSSSSSSSSFLMATKATKGGEYRVSQPPKGQEDGSLLALFWREFSASFKRSFLESLAIVPNLVAVGLLCALLLMYWPSAWNGPLKLIVQPVKTIVKILTDK